MVVRVGVIGAGIIGLSSAVQIQERLPRDSEVTIIADSFSPETTADGSAGFWKPHMLQATPIADIRHWSEVTWHHMMSIATSPLACQLGMYTVSGYSLSGNTTYKEEWFRDLVLGYRSLTSRELQMFPTAKSGVFFTTLQMNAVAYMSYLLDRFKKNGGKTIRKTLKSIQEIADDYDAIINCCGWRARKLVGDTEIQPIRGHLTKVDAPWQKHFVLKLDEPDIAFILPGVSSVVLGGADEVGNSSTEIRDEDKSTVLRRCSKLVPGMQNAKVIGHWVGLRPSRSWLRLELEHILVKGRNVPVIHNYGHGGSGVTLHWGCAQDAVNLLRSVVLGSKL